MENETKQSENINEPITENKADTAILSDEDDKVLATEMLQKYAGTLTDVLSALLPGHNVNSLIVSVNVDEQQFMTFIGTPQTLAANICAILEDDSIEFSRHLAYMAMASKKCQKFFKKESPEKTQRERRNLRKADVLKSLIEIMSVGGASTFTRLGILEN